jgi:hypothetical protein
MDTMKLWEKNSMTVSESIKYMEMTGKGVKYVGDSKPHLKRYFRLFRNETICELIPDMVAAARVVMQYNYYEFLSDGCLFEFEPCEKPA